jgi:hypothetical protein
MGPVLHEVGHQNAQEQLQQEGNVLNHLLKIVAHHPAKDLVSQAFAGAVLCATSFHGTLVGRPRFYHINKAGQVGEGLTPYTHDGELDGEGDVDIRAA